MLQKSTFPFAKTGEFLLKDTVETDIGNLILVSNYLFSYIFSRVYALLCSRLSHIEEDGCSFVTGEA
jgi:hypothetical protein